MLDADLDDKPTGSAKPLDAGDVVHACGPVMGIRFKDGVAIFGDCQITYGNLIRYKNVQRVFRINDNIIIGGTGEYADLRFVKDLMEAKVSEDRPKDGDCINAKQIFNWMREQMLKYTKEGTPRPVILVIGGFDENGAPFLGSVDPYGGGDIKKYICTESTVKTFDTLIASFMFDRKAEPSLKDVLSLIPHIMGVFYKRYIFCAHNYMLAVIKKEHAEVFGPLEAPQDYTEVEYMRKDPDWQEIERVD